VLDRQLVSHFAAKHCSSTQAWLEPKLDQASGIGAMCYQS